MQGAHHHAKLLMVTCLAPPTVPFLLQSRLYLGHSAFPQPGPAAFSPIPLETCCPSVPSPKFSCLFLYDPLERTVSSPAVPLLRLLIPAGTLFLSLSLISPSFCSPLLSSPLSLVLPCHFTCHIGIAKRLFCSSQLPKPAASPVTLLCCYAYTHSIPANSQGTLAGTSSPHSEVSDEDCPTQLRTLAR